MTPASQDPRQHRAPALWGVAVALVAACVLAVVDGARGGAGAIVSALVVAAVSRLVLRGRRPEGVAVRSTWVDVLLLGGLALGIFGLMFTPGV